MYELITYFIEINHNIMWKNVINYKLKITFFCNKENVSTAALSVFDIIIFSSNVVAIKVFFYQF